MNWPGDLLFPFFLIGAVAVRVRGFSASGSYQMCLNNTCSCIIHKCNTFIVICVV